MSDLDERIFDPLLGLPCWGVKSGYGTFLTLEFGEPREHIFGPLKSDSKNSKVRELLAKRQVFVHGEWHLWIYCCRWRVLVGDEVVGFSDLDGSTKDWMEKAAVALEGKTLVDVSLDPQRVTSASRFQSTRDSKRSLQRRQPAVATVHAGWLGSLLRSGWQF
jgi:hypothetical protein